MPRPFVKFHPEPSEAVNYMHRPMEDGALPDILGGTLPALRPEGLLREIARMTPHVRRQDTPSHPFVHVTLSLPAGMRLDATDWRGVIGIALDHLGLPVMEVPWQAVRHTDKQCDHAHVLVMSRTWSGRPITLEHMERRCDDADVALCGHLGLEVPPYFSRMVWPGVDWRAPARRLGLEDGRNRRIWETIAHVLRHDQPTSIKQFRAALAAAPDPVNFMQLPNQYGHYSYEFYLSAGTGWLIPTEALVRGQDLHDALVPKMLGTYFTFAQGLRDARQRLGLRRLIDGLMPQADVLSRLSEEKWTDAEVRDGSALDAEDATVGGPARDRGGDAPQGRGREHDRQGDIGGREGASAAPRSAEAIDRGGADAGPELDRASGAEPRLAEGDGGAAGPRASDATGDVGEDRDAGGGLRGGARDSGEDGDRDPGLAPGDRGTLAATGGVSGELRGEVISPRFLAIMKAGMKAKICPQVRRAEDATWEIAHEELGALRLSPDRLTVERAGSRFWAFCRALAERLGFEVVVDRLPWIRRAKLRDGVLLAGTAAALDAEVGPRAGAVQVLTLDGLSPDQAARRFRAVTGTSVAGAMAISSREGELADGRVVVVVTGACIDAAMTGSEEIIVSLDRLQRREADARVVWFSTEAGESFIETSLSKLVAAVNKHRGARSAIQEHEPERSVDGPEI